jgi:hypothetical protein
VRPARKAENSKVNEDLFWDKPILIAGKALKINKNLRVNLVANVGSSTSH